jgi:hypothetical protein
MNLTAVIAAIAHLDNALSRETGRNEALISITLDKRAFDAIVASATNGRPHSSNRTEIAGVVVRKATPVGRGDRDQPEIKPYNKPQV